MSPTYELPPGFAREFARMPREQRRAFQAAVKKTSARIRAAISWFKYRPVRPITDNSFRSDDNRLIEQVKRNLERFQMTSCFS